MAAYRLPQGAYAYARRDACAAALVSGCKTLASKKAASVLVVFWPRQGVAGAERQLSFTNITPERCAVLFGVRDARCQLQQPYTKDEAARRRRAPRATPQAQP